MKVFWTLVKRELGSFFFSWSGYVVMSVVLLLLGLGFTNLIEVARKQATDLPVTELFYGTLYFWLILLLVTPVITMRSFAHEKSSGTFETLMTTPVSDMQVMLAKFTGAWLVYWVIWLPQIACLLILRHYAQDTRALNAGSLSSILLGILLLGGLFISIGCFASALTRSQIIAAMVSFGIDISLFLLGFLAMAFSSEGGWQGQLLSHVGLLGHMEDFASGIVDTRPLVLYVSLIVFFQFVTLKALESRRWK